MLPTVKLRSQKLEKIQIDQFDGVDVLQSVTRLKRNEARDSTNMWLVEDGVWDKRPGTKTQITMGVAIDGFIEYVKADLTRELIIVSNGMIYKSTDMATTASISGATLTAGKACYFSQIGSYLFITNGTDPITRYDGTSLTQYTGLSAIGTVTPTLTGLTTGAYTAYYKVSAVNAVGETAPSAEVSQSVNKLRENWDATHTVTLSWSAVTNALAYNIYYSDTAGYEGLLTTVNGTSFIDDGTLTENPYVPPPNADSTGGPKLSYTWISGNRLWGVDPSNPYRVWFSGTGVQIGNFNSAYGGGWLEIEKGGRATMVGGKEFQGACYVLTSTPDGLGNLWKIEFVNQTVPDGTGSGVTIIIPVPTKVIGQVGSSSPRSIVLVENDMWFTNKYGEYVAGNEPNFYNLVRTNEISNKLRPFMQALNASSYGQICAYYYKQMVYISIATQSGNNNQTIVYNRERLAWSKPWTIGFTQFGQFTTSDSITHFLGSIGAKIVEINQSYADDDGVSFSWQYVSPQMPVDENWTQFMKVKKAYLRTRNLSGAVQMLISGTRKTKTYSSLASATITQGSSDTGLGWDQLGTVKMGDTSGKPTVFAQESLIKFLKINKLLRDIQWTISGSASQDRATITGIMAKGFKISAGDPSSWKLTAM